MPAPEIIHQLVSRFSENFDSYHSKRFNEEQLRSEFIEPFFKALGWDVYNDEGVAPDYREVVREATYRMAGSSTAPDYSFRLGRDIKFFVEAKKPSVNIQTDIAPAYQVRSYSWNLHLPIGVLTDFEEFAVYDCHDRPNPTDKASKSRRLFFTYKDYIEKWDEIASIFSRDAVWKGGFDKFASSVSKKGSVEVDDAFLEEIESWRKLLAQNIALRNPQVRDEHQLNYAVQVTLDRIIFLRICEDRGIEPSCQLQDLVDPGDIYPALLALFKKADKKYNSGLFHFDVEKGAATSEDTFTPSLSIDDRVLKEIITNLYPPKSPFRFNLMPVEILGQVYEQFLGRVIRLTPSHQAKVEEKPEVRKAGGVYYTPSYIVDYIVKNTVGKLLEGRDPAGATSLKIVDPACGSGSFLLGAFQFLIDWHEDWYVAHDPDKWKKGKDPALLQAPGGGWKLSTSKKKQILLNNIHGVDIDAQAVEVTKLSLLLKVLEEETGQLSLGIDRVLPDLGRNIQCGNSLIGEDYFDGRIVVDEEERRRINPFDWKRSFPQVFDQGGFDAVIGNPPYLFITEIDSAEKDYFFNHFQASQYRFDVYALFIEKVIKLLANDCGYLGYIIPHTLLNNDSYVILRNLLIQMTHLEEICDIGPGVFKNANNETMILLLRNQKVTLYQQTKVIISTQKTFPKGIEQWYVDQRDWANDSKFTFLIRNPNLGRVLKKLSKNSLSLGEICSINQGLRTGNNAKFLSPDKLNPNWKPVVGGKQISRYRLLEANLFVNYDPVLLDAPRKKEIFESPEKLVVQEIRNITLPIRIIATYDDKKFYCLQSTNVINLKSEYKAKFDIKYILGILNSRLINSFFKNRFTSNNHIASNQLSQIPIFQLEIEKQKFIVEKVNSLLLLTSKASTTPLEMELLTRKIANVENQINSTVYQLYGLTEDEIKIADLGF